MVGDAVERAEQGEMSTREAVAYMNEWTDFAINTEILYKLRSLQRGPIAEKRGRRLVYRRTALDAFLTENGTNPDQWHPWNG